MFMNIYRRCIAPLAVCALAFLLLSLASPAVHADGGAPNLAYVAGTAQGVSVIDVAQQKITSSIAVSGNPQYILLSTDARFLYVTQPQADRVAILAAKTGATVCTASVPGQPTLLALDTSSNLLFAAGNGASSVSEIDPTNCTIKRTFPTSGPVYGMYVATVGSSISGNSGNQLWVSDGNALTIFDDSTGQQLGQVTVPGGPQYVTIPPGATVYSTTRQGGVVAVDLNSHKVIPLISGGPYGPMDYDATTGEIYVPDQQNNRLVVLAPVNAGFPVPHEPGRTIDLSVRPESVAITSDGQLGFVALDGGNVAMIDIPGRQIINTFHVGGSPRFIITGLYPPAFDTTPQQASIWSTIITIVAYALVIVLILIPVLLLVRHSRARKSISKE
jgi:hypothetical protein